MSNVFSFQQAIAQIGTIRIMDLVDIALVAVMFYFIISLIRRTQTSKVFMGVVVILLALWLSGEMQLYTVNYLLRNAVQIGLLALVVLFQPEIRRFLEKIGTGTPFIQFFGGSSSTYTENAITQTVLACTDLSRTKTGALIIFERDNRLDDQVRTGTIIDGEVTAELLKNIFYPKAPLHDGAVIIRGGRILAGGCMLPLSENPNLRERKNGPAFRCAAAFPLRSIRLEQNRDKERFRYEQSRGTDPQDQKHDLQRCCCGGRILDPHGSGQTVYGPGGHARAGQDPAGL